ncbi:MAG: hypothetical protein ACREDK_01590 [Thermoplasmata archaeon]
MLASSVPQSTVSAVFAGATSTGPLDVAGSIGALHLLFPIALGLTRLAAVVNMLRGPRAPGARSGFDASVAPEP